MTEFEKWFKGRLDEQAPGFRAIVEAQREMAEEAWEAAIERAAQACKGLAAEAEAELGNTAFPCALTSVVGQLRRAAARIQE